MSELIPNRIIIDSKGTTKDVFNPSVSKPAEQPNVMNSTNNLAETVTAAVAGAVISEAVDFVQETLHGINEKPEDKKTDEKQTKAYNFNDIENNLMSGKLDDDQVRYFRTIRNARIEEFNGIDNGDFVRDTRIAVTRILRDSDWDDVYDELIHYGEVREAEMRGRAEIDDRLNGIAMSAIRYEASRVLVAGLKNKRNSAANQTEFNQWIKNKKSDQPYSVDELDRINELAKRSFVQLAPDAPEELVGKNVKKEEPTAAVEAPAIDLASLKQSIDELKQVQEQQLASQQRQERFQQGQEVSQQQQIELMKRGYSGLIQILDAGAPMDPRTYKMNLPPWYEAESSEFKRRVDFMANANYIAAIKRTSGKPDEVFGLSGSLSLNSRDFENMWNIQPGFKEAVVTMVSDIFDETNDKFVISGNPAKKEQKEKLGPPYEPYKSAQAATGGYAILESDTSILEYRANLSKKIGRLLDANRVNMSSRFHGVTNEDHATAAVSTVYNYLYAGGAFDSGDVKNKLNPGQPMAVTLSFRMLMMPGARGESKWVVDRDSETARAEEDFGGSIGEHYRWNAVHTPGYVDRIRNGDINYLPKRILYSLFEHVKFPNQSDGGIGPFTGKSLSEAMLDVSRATSVDRNGIKSPVPNIGFDQIDKGGDMFSDYVANAASYVLPLYNHLTSDDPKMRLDGKRAINLLIKVRKDELLREFFYGPDAEDMVTAIAGMAASPEGFQIGTDKLLLKVPEVEYIPAIRKVLNDDRWFDGMPSGFKERMITALNAPELLNNLRDFAMEFLPFLSNMSVNPRQGIRAEIRKNIGII